VRLPLGQVHALTKLRQQVRQLHDQEGRAPTADALAQALEMPPAEVEALWRVVRPPVSLDAPRLDDHATTSLDVLPSGSLPSCEEVCCQAALVAEVQRLLAQLTPREAQILRARFGFDGPAQTLAAIGCALALSRERVRQIEMRARHKLGRLAKRRALHEYLQ
jgi:RNA polymerase primary sigma factor